jgi:hypothetical protein
MKEESKHGHVDSDEDDSFKMEMHPLRLPNHLAENRDSVIFSDDSSKMMISEEHPSRPIPQMKKTKSSPCKIFD